MSFSHPWFGGKGEGSNISIYFVQGCSSTKEKNIVRGERILAKVQAACTEFT